LGTHAALTYPSLCNTEFGSRFSTNSTPAMHQPPAIAQQTGKLNSRLAGKNTRQQMGKALCHLPTQSMDRFVTQMMCIKPSLLMDSNQSLCFANWPRVITGRVGIKICIHGGSPFS
jgi:hypothetical protein